MPIDVKLGGCRPPSVAEMIEYDTLVVLFGSTGVDRLRDEEQAKEMLARLKVLENVFGPMAPRRDRQGYEPWTLKKLRRWMGLRSNATTETRGQFLKRVGGAMMESALCAVAMEG